MSVRTILSIVAILSLSLRADLMEARKFARKAEMQMRRGGYKIVSTRGAKLRTSEDKTFRVMYIEEIVMRYWGMVRVQSKIWMFRYMIGSGG